VHAHCESVEEHPVCPGMRFAVENANRDYYHAGVICSVDPCASEPPCTSGHVADPTCCSENVDGVPCVAVWRDSTSTLVSCDGGVMPCDTDTDCPESEWCRATGQKTRLFAMPLNIDDFTKTGSGQTYENSKKRRVSL
jgi:hypothetical protein